MAKDQSHTGVSERSHLGLVVTVVDWTLQLQLFNWTSYTVFIVANN